LGEPQGFYYIYIALSDRPHHLTNQYLFRIPCCLSSLSFSL
jgi:hypothetical protein